MGANSLAALERLSPNPSRAEALDLKFERGWGVETWDSGVWRVGVCGLRRQERDSVVYMVCTVWMYAHVHKTQPGGGGPARVGSGSLMWRWCRHTLGRVINAGSKTGKRSIDRDKRRDRGRGIGNDVRGSGGRIRQRGDRSNFIGERKQGGTSILTGPKVRRAPALASECFGRWINLRAASDLPIVIRFEKRRL